MQHLGALGLPRKDRIFPSSPPPSPAEQTEGAKFWLKVINDLKARGINDILDRGRGRAEGLSGSDHDGISSDYRADLHRAFNPQ